jgi:hypothetical protein
VTFVGCARAPLHRPPALPLSRPHTGRSPSRLRASQTEDHPAEDLSDVYTDVMQQRMGSAALVYRHEDGMNYTRILPDLIVGSCLQAPTDVDLLAEKEDVKNVLCLQENCDMEYFSLDVAPIQVSGAGHC